MEQMESALGTPAKASTPARSYFQGSCHDPWLTIRNENAQALTGRQSSGARRGLSSAWNASPITETDDGDVIGHLLLFFSVTAPLDERAQQFLDRVEYLLLVNTALAVGLIVVVGALLNRRLNAPLQRLADAARAVAEGDLEQQVQAGGSTEVAQVGQAFNEMTAALKEAETLRQNMVADVAHELRTPISVLQGDLWAILNDAYPLEKADPGGANLNLAPVRRDPFVESPGGGSSRTGFGRRRAAIPEPAPYGHCPGHSPHGG